MLRVTVRRVASVASRAKRSSPAIADDDVRCIEGARDYASQSFVMLDQVADVGLHSRRRGRPTPEDVRAGLITEDPFSIPPSTENDQREPDPPGPRAE